MSIVDNGVSDPRLPIAPLPMLRDRNIDPRKYGACGKSTTNAKGVQVIIGCSRFEDDEGNPCPLLAHFAKKFAGEKYAEYGPRNGGMRILKPKETGGGKREVATNCLDYLAKKDEVEKRGGMVDWVADEGEFIVTKGSRQEIKGGANESFVERFEIPKHARIDGSIRMVDAALEAEMRKIHDERQAQAKRDDMGGYKAAEPVAAEAPSEVSDADDAQRPKRR